MEKREEKVLGLALCIYICAIRLLFFLQLLDHQDQKKPNLKINFLLLAGHLEPRRGGKEPK